MNAHLKYVDTGVKYVDELWIITETETSIVDMQQIVHKCRI